MRDTNRTWMAALVAVAVAATVATAAGKPNPNHGKALYKSNCKLCHVKGGEAKDLTPLSKTQAQWQRVFAGPQIAAMAKKAEGKTGKALATTDIDDMQAFLVAHAADSDQPETCGQ